jgi:hypothetical protein
VSPVSRSRNGRTVEMSAATTIWSATRSMG